MSGSAKTSHKYKQLESIKPFLDAQDSSITQTKDKRCYATTNEAVLGASSSIHPPYCFSFLRLLIVLSFSAFLVWSISSLPSPSSFSLPDKIHTYSRLRFSPSGNNSSAPFLFSTLPYLLLLLFLNPVSLFTFLLSFSFFSLSSSFFIVFNLIFHFRFFILINPLFFLLLHLPIFLLLL